MTDPGESIWDWAERAARPVRGQPDWQKAGINLNPTAYETYRPTLPKACGCAGGILEHQLNCTGWEP